MLARVPRRQASKAGCNLQICSAKTCVTGTNDIAIAPCRASIVQISYLKVLMMTRRAPGHPDHVLTSRWRAWSMYPRVALGPLDCDFFLRQRVGHPYYYAVLYESDEFAAAPALTSAIGRIQFK